MEKIINIEELGLSSNNEIQINETTNTTYLITKDVNVLVNENVIVKIIDKSNNSKINIKGLKNSNIKYIIVDSVNSNREFDIKGYLDINQINLNETNESLSVLLNEENSEAVIKNLTINKNKESKYYQYVSHNKKATKSDIKNIAIAMSNSKVYYETTGKINKGMNNSNCRQLSRGVVMDDTSLIESKPILLIDEYDCFANHGAAIGKVNDEDLFYLMSRGLNKNDAFLLILSGIINPFVQSLDYEEYKVELQQKINKIIEG